MALERLLYVLAGQITGLLSPSGICRDLGLSQPTFDRYLSYLERAFLIFTLPNFSGYETRIQRRGRKLYIVDGAVRNAALQQRGLAPLDDPAEIGALIENLVAASVHTLAVHTGIRLHHWRDGNREVDLIFGDPSQPLAFEIGASIRHSRSGLAALIERHEHFRGHSYLVTPRATIPPPPPPPPPAAREPGSELFRSTPFSWQSALRPGRLSPIGWAPPGQIRSRPWVSDLYSCNYLIF